MRKLAALIAVALAVLLLAIACGEDPPTPRPPPPTPTPTVIEAPPFQVQPGEQESRWFDVDTPSSVSFSWTSTNRRGPRDGLPGEVDANLTGPGGLNVFWERRKERTDGFDAAPGRYNFTFNNWFSDFSAKEISLTIVITPR